MFVFEQSYHMCILVVLFVYVFDFAYKYLGLTINCIL